jgi:excisionase family DNA binding protein
MEKDILMTKKEAMDYLKISHQTLFRLMKQKDFPYFKLERKVLFRKSDIDKWLESKKVIKK